MAIYLFLFIFFHENFHLSTFLSLFHPHSIKRAKVSFSPMMNNDTLTRKVVIEQFYDKFHWCIPTIEKPSFCFKLTYIYIFIGRKMYGVNKKNTSFLCATIPLVAVAKITKKKKMMLRAVKILFQWKLVDSSPGGWK